MGAGRDVRAQSLPASNLKINFKISWYVSGRGTGQVERKVMSTLLWPEYHTTRNAALFKSPVGTDSENMLKTLVRG